MNTYRKGTLVVMATFVLWDSGLHTTDPVQAQEEPVIWSGSFESDWAIKWHVRKRQSWGLNGAKLIADPMDGFQAVLRVTYPKGSASPSFTRRTGAPVGGLQFVADLGMRPRDSLHLRYYLRFDRDFDFGKGGKLPGLFGGTVPDGGHIPDGTSGFSTRLMWRRRGAGEVYAYLPTSIQHGTSLGRGAWHFKPGQWHLVEQEVRLNAPGQRDGCIRLWVDEKQVVEEKNLVFRTATTLKIEGIFFSTFFGGNDVSWASPKTTYADFANFAVAAHYIGP